MCIFRRWTGGIPVSLADKWCACVRACVATVHLQPCVAVRVCPCCMQDFNTERGSQCRHCCGRDGNRRGRISRHIMSRHVMCHVMSCHVMSCVTSCRVMLCRVSCHVVSCHGTLQLADLMYITCSCIIIIMYSTIA